jgi:peptide chain release factor 2
MIINPMDVLISTYNTGTVWFPTHLGIVLKHIPTGIEVQCDGERGQHRNKAKAFDMLLAEVSKTDWAKQMELFNENPTTI